MRPTVSLATRIALTAAWIGALSFAGCAPSIAPPAATDPTTEPTSVAVPVKMQVTINGPKDARPIVESIVHLTIYIVDLPPGTVASDADFWKRVDEQAVGPRTAERLGLDGIRCGVAGKSEGVFFSHYFDTEPGLVRRQTVDGVHAGTIAIDFSRKAATETIFYINDEHQLVGRTYDDCKNQLSLAFGPTPRVPGSVRLTICPTVKQPRKSIAIADADGTVDLSPSVTDSLYDGSFTADVTGDSLLVISPGKLAGSSTSLGRNFLTRDDRAERREQVIVIVPTFLAVGGTTTIRSLGGS